MSSLICISYLTIDVFSQSVFERERNIKAAYLYNFANFVDWPEETDYQNEILNICVLGTDPFGKSLDAVRGKIVKGGKKVKVIRFSSLESAKIKESCHILFISPSEKNNFSTIISSLKDSNTLTVSDFKDFAKSGGTMNFYIKKNNVKIEINIDAAERAGLKISSKLLKIAKVIRD